MNNENTVTFQFIYKDATLLKFVFIFFYFFSAGNNIILIISW